MNNLPGVSRVEAAAWPAGMLGLTRWDAHRAVGILGAQIVEATIDGRDPTPYRDVEAHLLRALDGEAR